MIRYVAGLTGLLAVAAVIGCSSQEASHSTRTSREPSAEGAKYLLSSVPASPLDVIPMREAVADSEPVVVVGRIGGSHEPWIDGMAAFSIVDRSLAACTDISADKCPTPWDYCCVTDKLPAATTLVKLVDEEGAVVKTGAQELLGLSELQTVVVEGTAQKDEAGNVTILAKQIYVDPANPGQVKRAGVDGEPADDHDHDHDHGHDEDHAHGDDAEHKAEADHDHDKGES